MIAKLTHIHKWLTFCVVGLVCVFVCDVQQWSLLVGWWITVTYKSECTQLEEREREKTSIMKYDLTHTLLISKLVVVLLVVEVIIIIIIILYLKLVFLNSIWIAHHFLICCCKHIATTDEDDDDDARTSTGKCKTISVYVKCNEPNVSIQMILIYNLTIYSISVY